MNLASTIVTSTVNYLRGLSGLSGKTVLADFDGNISPTAVNAPVIAVGVNSLKAGEILTAPNANGVPVSQSKREFSLKVRIRFYVPFAGGVLIAYQLADTAYTSLLGTGFQYRVADAEMTAGKYDSQTDSIVVDTFFTVNSIIGI